MTASARQRSKPYRVPHLPKPVADPSPCGHASITARLASGPVPLPAPKSEERSGGVGRNAQGNQFALARVFWIPLRQFTLENHRVAAGPAAIIRQAQELSRFAASTLRQMVASRNTKTLLRCEEAVEDVSSLWKSEENRELILAVSDGARVGTAASAVR